MWPIVTTKLIKLCYGSTANTCLINRNNNFKIAKTHTWWVKALRTPSSLRANETKSSQIAFSPKYCWVCKASGTDNEAAETPAWVCTSQLKSQEGVSAGKSRKILRRGCCWGFSSSAPPDSSRPPPSSPSPLEASASPLPPRTQAGRPGNRWKCNQISQLVVLLPRGEVWDHYAPPRHRRAVAGGELIHKATWLRDRWPRRSALRELCCGGTERWLQLFLISMTKNMWHVLNGPSFNEIFLVKYSLTWKTTITQKRLMPVMSPRMVRTPT